MISEKNLKKDVKLMTLHPMSNNNLVYLIEKMKYSHISEKDGKYMISLHEYNPKKDEIDNNLFPEEIMEVMQGKEIFKAKLFFDKNKLVYMFYQNGVEKHVSGEDNIYNVLEKHDLNRNILKQHLEYFKNIAYTQCNGEEETLEKKDNKDVSIGSLVHDNAVI